MAVSNTFQRSITQARGSGHDAYAKKTEELLAAYDGGAEFKTNLDQHINNLYKDSSNKSGLLQHSFVTQTTKRVIGELSQAYESEPIHNLIDENDAAIPLDDPRYSAFDKLLTDVGYYEMMPHNETRTNLLNSSIIHCVPNFPENKFRMEVVESSLPALIQGADASNFYSSQFIAVPMADNTETFVSRPNAQGYWIYQLDRETNELNVWIADSGYNPIEVDEDTQADLNKYKTMSLYPMVLSQSEIPQRGDIFVDAPYDLLDISYWYCWRRTARSYWIKLKEPVPYVTDMEGIPNNIGLSASSIISGAGDLHSVDFDPQTEQYNRDMQVTLNLFGQSRFLPKAWADDLVAESGIAQYYRDTQTRKFIKKMQRYFKRLEESKLMPMLFEMASVVDHPSAPLLEGVRVITTFKPPVSEIAPTELRALQSQEIAMGITSAVEIRAEERGISLDDARKELETIKNIQAEPEPIEE